MISPLKVLSLALAATAVNGAMTAQQMVNNIEVLTQDSKNLQTPANSISILDSTLFIVGAGQYPILTGFQNIVSAIATDITEMADTQPFTNAADEEALVGALTDFVQAHQVLLQILIGKAGLFSLVPLIGVPVAAALSQVESIVDTFAYGLIDLLSDKAPAASASLQQSSFDGTIVLAINAYSGTAVAKKRSYPVAFRG